MRVMVTGGAGFIGSHLVDALTARGDEVLVLDDFSSGRSENLAVAIGYGIAISETSVTDRARVSEVIEEFEPEAVFHLAAQVDVRKSVADAGFDAEINLLGTINILDAVISQSSHPP